MESILKFIVVAHVSVAARWASRRVSHVQDVVASTVGVPSSNRYFVAVYVCAILNVAILEWDRRSGDGIYVPNPTTIVDWAEVHQTMHCANLLSTKGGKRRCWQDEGSNDIVKDKDHLCPKNTTRRSHIIQRTLQRALENGVTRGKASRYLIVYDTAFGTLSSNREVKPSVNWFLLI